MQKCNKIQGELIAFRYGVAVFYNLEKAFMQGSDWSIMQVEGGVGREEHHRTQYTIEKSRYRLIRLRLIKAGNTGETSVASTMKWRKIA